eukprot:1156910-Pelagomonas_calceolata.AAC.2
MIRTDYPEKNNAAVSRFSERRQSYSCQYRTRSSQRDEDILGQDHKKPLLWRKIIKSLFCGQDHKKPLVAQKASCGATSQTQTQLCFWNQEPKWEHTLRSETDNHDVGVEDRRRPAPVYRGVPALMAATSESSASTAARRVRAMLCSFAF